MQACYRKLTNYKYQLVKGYTMQLDLRPEKLIQTRFIKLDVNGELMIVKEYAWDGTSGPVIDTNSNMRASLVHDALYQLMRLGKLDYRLHREYADRIFNELCLADGVCRPAAAVYFRFLRTFGEKYARPSGEFEIEEICVP